MRNGTPSASAFNWSSPASPPSWRWAAAKQGPLSGPEVLAIVPSTARAKPKGATNHAEEPPRPGETPPGALADGPCPGPADGSRVRPSRALHLQRLGRDRRPAAGGRLPF